MKGRYEFNITESAFRTYQLQAYRTLVQRVNEGAKGISLVLPPRVGKTDVMRIGGLRLVRDKWASAALILVPDRILLHQTFGLAKARESYRRYELDYLPNVYSVSGDLRYAALREADLVGMTIQLATSRLPVLTRWVADMTRTHGCPPVVFVDECHTVSGDNVWGNTLAKLQDSGCPVVMLTATPFRTDRRPIPNFDLEPVGEDWIHTFYRPVSDGRVGQFEQTNQLMQMKPDHLTKFREVWDEADPPILCKIYHRKFDIFLSERLEATEEITGAVNLSELLDPSEEDEVRQVLRTELRKPHIIERAVSIFIDEMVGRRGASGTEKTQGIIFVGSDSEQLDSRDNRHARDVMNTLRRLSHDQLSVAIATSDDDAAIQTIDSFVAGQIDVVIVKQMAGRGLDVPSLKVELDLSNIRTANSFIQRVTRICTMWQYGTEAKDLAQYGTYISPEDCLSTTLFNRFIRDESGEFAIARGHETLLRTFEPNGSPPEPRTFLEGEEVIPPTVLEDSDLHKAPGGWLDFVDFMWSDNPNLYNAASKAQFAESLEEAVRRGLLPRPEGMPDPPEPPQGAGARLDTHRDLEAEYADLQEELVNLSKRIAYTLVIKRHGRYTPDQYQVVIKRVWVDHYQRIQRAGDSKVYDLTLDELRMMKANMNQHWETLKPPAEGEQGRFSDA